MTCNIFQVHFQYLIGKNKKLLSMGLLHYSISYDGWIMI